MAAEDLFTPEKLVQAYSNIEETVFLNENTKIGNKSIEISMEKVYNFKNQLNPNGFLNQSDLNMARALQANSLDLPSLTLLRDQK